MENDKIACEIILSLMSLYEFFEETNKLTKKYRRTKKNIDKLLKNNEFNDNTIKILKMISNNFKNNISSLKVIENNILNLTIKLKSL